MPKIVHLSGDFPDPVDSFKTPVIRTLLELSEDGFSHKVYSINRRSPGLARAIRSILGAKLDVSARPFEWGEAVEYLAPGRGAFHATMLHRLGEWLADQLSSQGRPDLLVGHKLTIEGIAVRRAARLLGIPYAISVQGNTDTKILDARPDLKPELAAVYHGAAVAMPFTPWALRRVEAKLGRRSGPTVLVPCPTDMDNPIAPRRDGEGLVSVFHLKNVEEKNLHGIAAAVRRLERERSPIAVNIIGGGTEQDLERCRGIAKGANGLSFVGAMDHAALPERINRYAGFVLPSVRESFGLVFIEAVSAGLPIIYPKNMAIDGYFDGAPFAIRVDPRDPAEIAEAMKRVVADQATLKAELEEWQKSPKIRQFTREGVAKSFKAGLELAVAGAPPAGNARQGQLAWA